MLKGMFNRSIKLVEIFLVNIINKEPTFITSKE